MTGELGSHGRSWSSIGIRACESLSQMLPIREELRIGPTFAGYGYRSFGALSALR